MNEFELKIMLEQICSILGTPAEQVKSPSRITSLVDARKIFAWKAREKGASLKKIGKSISRDHSTILWMERKYLDLLINEDFREKVLLVERALKVAA